VIADTGINKGIVEKAMVKFQEAKKIFFYEGYVFLYNASKYETYSGELNERSKERLLSELSNNVLDWYKRILDRGIDTPLKGTINHNTEIINKKSEIINKKGQTLRDKTIKYLEAIPSTDIDYFLSWYKLDNKQLQTKASILADYCRMHNKGYHDPKAFLRNALAKEYGKRDKPIARLNQEIINLIKNNAITKRAY
jgi:hypothetical protein